MKLIDAKYSLTESFSFATVEKDSIDLEVNPLQHVSISYGAKSTLIFTSTHGSIDK